MYSAGTRGQRGVTTETRRQSSTEQRVLPVGNNKWSTYVIVCFELTLHYCVIINYVRYDNNSLRLL